MFRIGIISGQVSGIAGGSEKSSAGMGRLVKIPLDCVHVILYPLIPHFYLAKLGYVGVYLFSVFLLQNIDCGYSLEPPRRGGSNVYPQAMF